MEEHEQLKRELLAALAELQKSIEGYAGALNRARQLARQGYTTAVNLKKRVGREELAGKDLPAGITEVLSYRIPAFRYKRVLLCCAAFSIHCSIFPTASVIEKFGEELQAYTVSKAPFTSPGTNPFRRLR